MLEVFVPSPPSPLPYIGQNLRKISGESVFPMR